jgi:hypothetical protein
MAHRLKFLAWALMLGILGLDPLPKGDQTTYIAKAMAQKSIEAVLAENTPRLMSIPGVQGTAQGLCDGKPCIVIYVLEKSPELERRIPPSLENYPVKIEETGPIRALPKK